MDNQLSRQGGIPLTERACQAIMQRKVVLPTPVWSRIRFNAPRTGAGPFVYTTDTTERRAFAYGIGGSMATAGFLSTDIATGADTNLTQASITPDNADFELFGLGIFVEPGSNPDLVAELTKNCDVILALSSSSNQRIGTITTFPQPGGLFGASRGNNLEPSVLESTSPMQGFIANGRPDCASYKHFPEPFVWAAQGSTEKDTSLVVVIQPRRACVVNAPASRAAIAADPAITTVGQPAWTAPADGSVSATFRLEFIARSIGNAGINFG